MYPLILATNTPPPNKLTLQALLHTPLTSSALILYRERGAVEETQSSNRVRLASFAWALDLSSLAP